MCAGVLWGKHDGDGKQLAAWQSMVSGFSAACLGPTVTNPFDVIKARLVPMPALRLTRAHHRAQHIWCFGFKTSPLRTFAHHRAALAAPCVLRLTWGMRLLPGARVEKTMRLIGAPGYSPAVAVSNIST